MKKQMLQWFKKGYQNEEFIEQPESLYEYIKYTEFNGWYGQSLVDEFNEYANTNLTKQECYKLQQEIIDELV